MFSSIKNLFNFFFETHSFQDVLVQLHHRLLLEVFFKEVHRAALFCCVITYDTWQL